MKYSLGLLSRIRDEGWFETALNTSVFVFSSKLIKLVQF